MYTIKESDTVLRTTIHFIIILLILPLALFAKPYSLGLGGVQELQIEVGDSQLQTADIVDVHNWATGSELRFQMFDLITLDGYALIKQGDIINVTEEGKPVFENEIYQRFFGMLTLGLTTKVAALTTLSLGAGTSWGVDLYSHNSPHFWISDKENLVGVTPFEDFIKSLSISYRARLDFNFSRYSLGIFFAVPSIAGENDTLAPDWEKGKIGAAFITQLF